MNDRALPGHLKRNAACGCFSYHVLVITSNTRLLENGVERGCDDDGDERGRGSTGRKRKNRRHRWEHERGNMLSGRGQREDKIKEDGLQGRKAVAMRRLSQTSQIQEGAEGANIFRN